jgi:phage gp36-like protein
MIFLTQSDFDTAIKADNLNQILNNNMGLLDAAVLAAVQEIQSYLKSKYDVASIFSKTGEERNAQVVMYAIDISLYHIHARVAPRQLPEARVARYEQSVEWLKGVMRGNIIPDLPKLSAASESSLMWGGTTPFRYQ